MGVVTAWEMVLGFSGQHRVYEPTHEARCAQPQAQQYRMRSMHDSQAPLTPEWRKFPKGKGIGSLLIRKMDKQDGSNRAGRLSNVAVSEVAQHAA